MKNKSNKFIALIICVVLALSLCSCSNKKAEKFKTIYSSMYIQLQAHSENCDKLTDMIYTIWDIVETEHIIGTLKYMLQVSDDFEDYWENGAYPMGDFYECLLAEEFGWLKSSYYGISLSSDAEEFHTMCMNLQGYYNSVQSKNESIAGEMKILYEEYGKDFESEYNLINDLYSEISTYAEFALEPSGSLASYSSAKREYQSNITRYLKAAEIY